MRMNKRNWKVVFQFLSSCILLCCGSVQIYSGIQTFRQGGSHAILWFVAGLGFIWIGLNRFWKAISVSLGKRF